MIARRRDMSLPHGKRIAGPTLNLRGADAGTPATDEDMPVPSVEPIEGAPGDGGDLPAEYQHDRPPDQQSGKHDGDGDAQEFCPWCGGALRGDSIEVANRMRDAMEESASQWRAECLAVKKASSLRRHRAGARRLVQVVRRMVGDLLTRRPAKNSPNPAAADDDPVE